MDSSPLGMSLSRVPEPCTAIQENISDSLRVWMLCYFSTKEEDFDIFPMRETVPHIT